MEDLVSRLNKAVESIATSPTEFATRAGIDPSNFRKMLKGGYTISKANLAKIAALGVSIDWLQTGEGDMLVGAKHNAELPGVPFIGDSEYVAAGALAGFGSAIEMRDVTDYVHVPSMPDAKPGDFAVRTRGRSMIDTAHPEQNINDGAIVCARRWNEDFIMWGEIYCIATLDGYAVKRLMPSEREGCVRCVSSNEAEGYLPYELRADQIKDIAKVTAIINLQLL